jgi:hypothetical protein
MTVNDFKVLVTTHLFDAHNTDKKLLLALAKQESSLDENATRFEPEWQLFKEPLLFSDRLVITFETEQTHQATSWGLMQIMGVTARDLGFKGQLPSLIYPDVNIVWGYKKIVQLRKKYPDLLDVIASYNSGIPHKEDGVYINKNYVDSVYKHYTEDWSL